MENMNFNISMPPPPVPTNLNILNLEQKEKKPDPVKEKLLLKAKEFEGDPTAEIAKKYKLTEEKNPDAFLESDATGIKPEENLENKMQCPKCEKFVLKFEFQSHINSHTSQVLDWLFIGGEVNANNLKELQERDRVDCIINMTEEVANYFPDDFIYINYSLLDEVKENISSIFEDCSQKIFEFKSQNKRVLVHCIQGISRSVSMVIAYLMLKENYKLKDAYQLVKDKRALARPNKGFLNQLMKLEKQIYGENTLTIEDLYPPGTITFMSLNDKFE